LSEVIAQLCVCADVNIRNTNYTFADIIASGVSYVLADSDWDINVNGNLEGSVTLPTLDPDNEIEVNLKIDTFTYQPENITLTNNVLDLEIFDFYSEIAEMFEARVLEDSGEFEAIECLIQTLQNEFI